MIKNIYITKPVLPNLDLVVKDLKKIWKSRILTNRGPYNIILEKKLAKFLKCENLSLVSNGTDALILAIKALNLKGDIITTPFSFPATIHAIKWTNNNPIFVDICSNTFNINENLIEKAITKKTVAILVTNCYGIPCEFKKINLIAKKYKLKIIYDSSHCFGVSQGKHSLLNNGDISTISFHATKVFNTFEGGAVICRKKKDKKKIDFIKNFGFKDNKVVCCGVNSKLNEFSSVIGIHQLKIVNHAIKKRKLVAENYMNLLSNNKNIKLINYERNLNYNYSYFPILLQNSLTKKREKIINLLKKKKYT